MKHVMELVIFFFFLNLYKDLSYGVLLTNTFVIVFCVVAVCSCLFSSQDFHLHASMIYWQEKIQEHLHTYVFLIYCVLPGFIQSKAVS